MVYANCEIVGSCLRITLDHPARRNAIDQSTMVHVSEQVERAGSGAHVRAILLRGAGSDFCSGADLAAANGGDRPLRVGHVQRRSITGANRLVRALWEAQLPVVAAVRGVAAGLGFGLVLASDLVIAAPEARFLAPFAARGLSPDSATTFLLPHVVGLARAKRVLVFGQELDARTAQEWGVVADIVDDLDGAADEAVARASEGATVATGLAKWLVNRNVESGLGHAFGQENLAVELALRSPDFREGITAFQEHRAPRFTGG